MIRGFRSVYDKIPPRNDVVMLFLRKVQVLFINIKYPYGNNVKTF